MMNKETKLELIKLLLTPESQPLPQACGPDLGPQQIMVLDRGFVYVGDAELQGEFWLLRNARNIRVWGTTKGLGELCAGPTEKTRLDDVGEVLIPVKAVISIIKCTRSW